MKLLTLRTSVGDTAATTAVRQDGDTLTEIPGFADVGALLQDPAWETTAKAANGATHALDGAALAAVVPSPGKIICV
ncbi:MAG: FAA hydrolase family protein, partial [Pseudarthrobacter sp.]